MEFRIWRRQVNPGIEEAQLSRNAPWNWATIKRKPLQIDRPISRSSKLSVSREQSIVSNMKFSLVLFTTVLVAVSALVIPQEKRGDDDEVSVLWVGTPRPWKE
ncbi:hypothetical protein BT69DRAFT_1352237 [Atractiella rhizophila]|nr:hypothetical protein BT69DRAFT_1352237 [Atractiella rhizophila]